MALELPTMHKDGKLFYNVANYFSRWDNSVREYINQTGSINYSPRIHRVTANEIVGYINKHFRSDADEVSSFIGDPTVGNDLLDTKKGIGLQGLWLASNKFKSASDAYNFSWAVLFLMGCVRGSYI